MNPDPRSKVRLHRVEKVFHGDLNLRYHILKLGVIDHMLRSVEGQDEGFKPLSVYIFVQLQQNR